MEAKIGYVVRRRPNWRSRLWPYFAGFLLGLLAKAI